MDTYETLNNCPFSEFDSIGKFGVLTGLENEKCNLDKDEKQSMKPLKYFTRNFFDKTIIQNRGVFFHDGFGIPSCEVDNSTKSRFGATTNINLVQNLPALPLPTTASYAKGQGSVSIEQMIRPQHNRELKQCNPKDTDFYNRHFSIFEGLPIVPNKCVDNVVQNGSPYRQGVDTRHMLNTSYRRGNYCGTNKNRVNIPPFR